MYECEYRMGLKYVRTYIYGGGGRQIVCVCVYVCVCVCVCVCVHVCVWQATLHVDAIVCGSDAVRFSYTRKSVALAE